MTKAAIVLTGAHLTPALAVAKVFAAQNWQIYYFGRDRDKNHLQGTGINFHQIDAGKFSRHQPLSLLWLFLKLPLATIKSIKLLKAAKPKAVLSFGGHNALPVCLAAWLLRLPLIIHEQTFVIGFTNRLTALFADKVAISWPNTRGFSQSAKLVLTGNPIRQSLINLTRRPNPVSPILYITGGHQGSAVINQAVTAILPELLSRFKIYHQFGLNQNQVTWEKQRQFKKKLPKKLQAKYQLKRWFKETELADILATCQMVIGRAGANTATELALLQIPSLLIPLPIARSQEQLLNAQFLQSLGLSIILPQTELSSSTLKSQINKALKTLPLSPVRSLPAILKQQAASNLYQLVTSTIRARQKI